MLAFDAEDRPTGMEVAKICRQLLDMLDGEHLEDWARHAVESTTEFSPSGDEGSLVGQVLAAETGLSEMDIDMDSETMALPLADTPGIHATPTVSLPLDENQGPRQEGETRDSKINYAGGVAAILVLATIGGFFLTQEPASLPETPVQAAPAAPATAAEDVPAEPDISEEPPLDIAAPVAAPTATPSPSNALRPESQAPPPVEVAQEQEEEAAPPPAEPAMVRIASIPFGVPVEVDGKSVGKTPLKDLELMTGPHTLTFLDKDERVEREVRVLPGNKNLWTYRRSDGSIE